MIYNTEYNYEVKEEAKVSLPAMPSQKKLSDSHLE